MVRRRGREINQGGEEGNDGENGKGSCQGVGTGVIEGWGEEMVKESKGRSVWELGGEE